MLELFGTSIFDLIKDKIIYNAGTMAGRQSVFSEFCLEVFLILLHSKTSKTYKIYPDQAAVNLLLHLTRYFEATKFAAAESAWACQLGTVGNVDYKVLLTEPEPRFNGLEVVTSLGTPFSLVHQYDRFPHWMGPIRERFWT